MAAQKLADKNSIKNNPCVLVIFGGTGSLTYQRLIPALYQLKAPNLLPEKIAIFGVARRKMSQSEYRESLLEAAKKYSRTPIDLALWDDFAKAIDYYPVEFNNHEDFTGLAKKLEDLERTSGVCFNRVFYLATAPSFFPVIFEAIKKSGLNIGCARHNNPPRIVVEKPFGADLPSARDLNSKLNKVFSEDQIYRIDHYFAKETVQNMLAFRFANEIFEPILNKGFVDNIQITKAEEIGVEARGEYYEEAGALRDMIQNHLLQVLAVTTMGEPKKFAASTIRAEKVKLLGEVRTIKPSEVEDLVVRGQYGSGEINGQKVAGYRQEPEVAADSSIETFVALKLFIDNPFWQGVPIYLKTGKRLAADLTTISIQFKEAGHALFDHLENPPQPNILTFQLEPDEGIAIRLVAKRPGLKMQLTDVDMEFCYASAFREALPESYEQLLLDVMLGDQTLFPHVDEVLRSWEIVDNILKGWESLPAPKFPNYAAGSWGPKESDELIKRDGRVWLAHELKICQLHPRH